MNVHYITRVVFIFYYLPKKASESQFILEITSYYYCVISEEGLFLLL